MKKTREFAESLTLKFSEIAREKSRRGEKILSLGLGEPDFDTPQPIIDATFDAIKMGYTKYSDSMGLIELREFIQKKLKKDNGIETRTNNIVVTPGAKNAMMLSLMALLDPGDEVINFTPCYVSYVPQIKIAEPTAVVHNIDLRKNDLSIDWDLVKDKINDNTKVIIMNFPHNPTGRMLLKEDVENLLALAEKAHFYIVSDEIYEKLNYSGMPNISIGSYEAVRNRVFTINGFSKAFSMTGWRIGYVAGPPIYIEVISKLQQHINTNTTTFVQKGSCAAFLLLNDYLDKYKFELKEKADFLVEAIDKIEKLHLVCPKGGLFAFLDISKLGLSSDEFAYKLLEAKNVACTPGVAFGKNWDDHIRISMSTKVNEFKEAIKALVDYVESA